MYSPTRIVRNCVVKLLKKARGANKNCCKCLSTSTTKRQIKNDVSSLYIFDRQTKYLQRERAALAADANLYDYLKDEIGFRVSDRVLDVKRKFKNAADIGCGRGYITKHLLSDSVEEVLLCDSNRSNLDRVEPVDGIRMKRMVVDEEYLAFEPDTFDLVMSSLSLHWVNNLPGAFKAVMNGLKPDGVLIAAVFGGDTLYELRSSLQLAELERRGGLSPHISPFADIRDVGGLMNQAGFTMLTIDTEEVVIAYPSMFELMWDLKGMAENNAAFNRSLHMNRDVQFAAAAIYEQLYGREDKATGRFGVPATFQIINMVGWKPHASQPKPIERGTGEVSLKDLHRLDEIVKDIKKLKKDDDKVK